MLFGALFLMSAMQADETLTRVGENVFVQTKTIGKQFRGYKGYTPVRITIRQDKVVRVDALPNQETPQYFEMAKTLLKNFEGKTVKQAAKMKVDAVSGATYSSEALIGNVKAGLEYYQKNK